MANYCYNWAHLEDYEDFVKYHEDVVAELTPQDLQEIKEQFNQIKK